MARVLIVDDALTMRSILSAMLEESGHEIVGIATNAAQAKKLFDKLQPDLVTVDALMEGVDGITCLREIMRADPQARVIMISAQGSGQLEKESLDAGARGYVAKPIDLERLQAEIEKALAD